MKNRPKGRFFYVLNIAQLDGNLFKLRNEPRIDFKEEIDRADLRTAGKFKLLKIMRDVFRIKVIQLWLTIS
ncbi:hypothetical protein BEN71_17965 [Acinetobacter wuhouensis]|nr:hypothetical protein BEN71_17965 [Acinetobacter wuhouensis]